MKSIACSCAKSIAQCIDNYAQKTTDDRDIDRYVADALDIYFWVLSDMYNGDFARIASHAGLEIAEVKKIMEG